MRTLGKIGFGFVFLLLVLEALLRVVDPWGIQQAMATSRVVYEGYAIDGDRVILVPGTYDNGDWHYTVLADGTRRVPESSADGQCTLAFVGDSVTFGWGVNDEDTFASVVASARPEWRVLNYGVAGYNRGDIQRLLQTLDVDAVVWLTIENDDGGDLASQIYGGSDPATGLLLEQYGRGLQQTIARNQQGPVVASDAYITLAKEVLADGVQIFSFADNPLPAGIPGVHWLPAPTHTISRGDPHPNAQGHREIAEAMLPDLMCGDQVYLSVKQP